MFLHGLYSDLRILLGQLLDNICSQISQPSGMVLEPLDKVNIFMCATSIQGNSIIKPKLYVAFINIQKEILGEYTT